MSDKLEFKFEEKDYVVVKPSARQEKDGMIIFAKTLTKALKEGIMSQDGLDKYMRKEGTWDDEKQNKSEEITKFLRDGVVKLAEGGFKKSEARKLAIEMRIKRMEYLQLIFERSRLEGCTAESIAEKERTDFFVSVCTKNADGTKVFNSVEDFQDKQSDELATLAATKFAQLYNGYSEDLGFSKLPENEFLVKYGFANNKLELVNEEGKFVDIDGNLVEEPQKIEFKEFLEG